MKYFLWKVHHTENIQTTKTEAQTMRLNTEKLTMETVGNKI